MNDIKKPFWFTIFEMVAPKKAHASMLQKVLNAYKDPERAALRARLASRPAWPRPMTKEELRLIMETIEEKAKEAWIKHKAQEKSSEIN